MRKVFHVAVFQSHGPLIGTRGLLTAAMTWANLERAGGSLIAEQEKFRARSGKVGEQNSAAQRCSTRGYANP